MFFKTTICGKFYPKVGVTISDFDFFIVNVKLLLKGDRLSTFRLEDYNFCFFFTFHSPGLAIFTWAEREVKDSRCSGMYQSCHFLTRLGKQSR